jgi:hypothetical protein
MKESVMLPPLISPRKTISILLIQISLIVWMGMVIFVFLVLFGPQEFWILTSKLGIHDELIRLQTLLQSFFTATYQS